MDVRQLSQDYLVVIFLLTLQGRIYAFDDDRYEDEDSPSFDRCPWIRNKLKNGRVKIRSRGRIAKFICDPGYELAGKRFATCVRGHWNNPIPVCVARGCSRKPPVSNGRITEMYRGAVLVYDCNPGYSLDGQVSIYCDGRRWSTEPPACVAATAYPETSCDFEDPDLCGWTHDPNHDFDWKRNQFATPSGHDGTGPSYDHTFGINKGGFYLYLEASSPRKTNDTTRLFSPVYSPDYNDGCFTFWYHMYGADTGGIRVYLKRESQVFDEIAPTWVKFGDQGQQWLRGYITIPTLHENFQIVIEGLRGTGYIGDSAIDDVQLSKDNCESIDNSTDTVAHTAADSCRGRCREPDEEASCGCNENCDAHDTCCSDYIALCTTGNDTLSENTDEPLPEDELGKTSSPVTVTFAILTSLKSTITPQYLPTQKTTPQSTTQTPIPSTLALSISPTATASSNAPSLSVSTNSTSSSTLATETNSTLYSTTLTKSLSVETKITELNHYSISEEPLSSSTLSTITDKTSLTTLAPTPKVTTVSTPVTNATITVSSTAQKLITSSTVSSVVTPINTTQKYISEISLTHPSSENISKPVTLPATNNTTISRESGVTSSSVSTSITSTPSTRKTYNLRPRTQKTTPISSEVTFNSTASNTSPLTNTANSSSTEILNASSITTAISVVTPTNSHKDDEDDHGHGRLNDNTTEVFSSSTSTMKSTTIKLSQNVSTTKSNTVTTNRPTIFLTEKTWFTRSTTSKLPLQDSGSSQTPLLVTKTLQEYHVSSAASTETLPIITIISITIVVIICVAAGLTYYIKKQKARRQSQLSQDSEMRFLSNSEEMEYSDASFLDKILVK